MVRKLVCMAIIHLEMAKLNNRTWYQQQSKQNNMCLTKKYGWKYVANKKMLETYVGNINVVLCTQNTVLFQYTPNLLARRCNSDGNTHKRGGSAHSCDPADKPARECALSITPKTKQNVYVSLIVAGEPGIYSAWWCAVLLHICTRKLQVSTCSF